LFTRRYYIGAANDSLYHFYHCNLDISGAPTQLPSSHNLHKLCTRLRALKETALFTLHEFQRVQTWPEISDLPNCVVLNPDVVNFDHLIDLDSFPIKNALIRREYIEALDAVFRWAAGTHPSSRPSDMEVDIAVPPPESDDDVLPPGVAFQNPFLAPTVDFYSNQGGFILTGHPGIGELLFPASTLVPHINVQENPSGYFCCLFYACMQTFLLCIKLKKRSYFSFVRGISCNFHVLTETLRLVHRIFVATSLQRLGIW
jgi:hypothetical protein